MDRRLKIGLWIVAGVAGVAMLTDGGQGSYGGVDPRRAPRIGDTSPAALRWYAQALYDLGYYDGTAASAVDSSGGPSAELRAAIEAVQEQANWRRRGYQPTGNLDTRTQQEIQTQVRELDPSTTVVHATNGYRSRF